jgi:hypothetical protein
MSPTDGRPRDPRLAVARAWGAALLAASAAALAAAPASASTAYRDAVLATPGVQHYWRLGEQSGLVANDLAQACEHGPGRYGEQVALGLPGAIAGDPDTAAGFDGATPDGVWGSSVSTWCPDDTSPHRAPGTVEAWIKPARLDRHTRRIYAREDVYGGAIVGAGADGLVFSRFVKEHTSRRWDTALRRYVDTRYPGRATTLRVPVRTGRWAHVVAAYDGARMTLAVDGRQVAERGSDVPVSAITTRLGAGYNGYLEWDGLLDEVALYDRALSSADAARHFDAAG